MNLIKVKRIALCFSVMPVLVKDGFRCTTKGSSKALVSVTSFVKFSNFSIDLPLPCSCCHFSENFFLDFYDKG